MAKKKSRRKKQTASKKATGRGRRATAANCTWELGESAHVMTWFLLLMREEFEAAFPDAKDIKVSELKRYWLIAANPAQRRFEAEAYSALIDLHFRERLRSDYEAGKGFDDAIADLSAILVDEEATLCQLGHAVDDVYKLRGEAR